jgi:hypothetical protein
LYQLLHASRLFRGGLQVLRDFGRRRVVQRIERRLDKTQRHRQRCFQFVRNVGDKIATHGGELLQLRHVAHQQQRASRGKGRRLDLQRAPGIPLRLQVKRGAAMVRAVEICQELRLTQQVRDATAGIGRGLEPEAGFGLQVHPLDGTVPVEDERAVRQGFGGAAKPRQFLGNLFALDAGQPGAPVQGLEGRAPGTGGARRRRTQRAPGPTNESHHHPKLAQENKAGGRCQKQNRTALAGREPPGQRRQHCKQDSHQKLGCHRPHVDEIR